MREFLKTKPFGFFLNLAAGAFSIAGAILYLFFYRDSNEYLLVSFLLPLITGCLICLLSFLPFIEKYVSYFGVAGLAASVAAFFYATYYYISVVMTGIDLQNFAPEYLAIVILLLSSFLIESIALFFQNPPKTLTRLSAKVIRVSLKGFFVPLALLAFLGLFGESAAFANEGAINAQFGINPYHLERGNTSLNSDYFESAYEDIASLREDGEALVAEVEEEGAVLLKNENAALPLDADSSVTLFSLSSVDPAYGGEGSSAANNPKAPLDFQTALEEASIHVNPSMHDWYRNHKQAYAPSGYAIKDAPWTDFSGDAGIASSFADYGDAAIVVLKRVRGENTDVPFQEATCDGENGNYLALNANERSVLAGLAALKGTTFQKIIVLLNTPNPLELSFLNDYPIDALMWVGTLGQTGLAGVARLLSGEANPSGKLSDTFYYRHSENPVMANWGPSTYRNYENYLDQLPSIGGKSYSSMQYASYVAYQEGIYVGYRYTETRYEDVISSRDLAGDFDYPNIVAYPFGFGLSYTSFSYGNLTHHFDPSSDEHHLSIDVTNVGQKAGKEAVQLYLQKPYTEYDEEHGIEKSAIDLVDYAKTRLLDPGEKETLSFLVPGREFASYDADGIGTYLVEESSDYRFAIGSSCHNAINNILAEKGYSEADGMDAVGNPSLVQRISKVRDETTYSKSETGAKIQNLFDSMDMNRFAKKGENSIAYLSRADWIDTLPSQAASLQLNDGMMEDLLAQDKGEVASDDLAYPAYGADNDLSLVDLMQDEDGDPIALDNNLWDLLLDELSYEDTARLLTTGLRKTTGLESIAKPMTVDHNGPTGLVLPYEQSDGLAQRLGDPDGSYSPPYYPCLGILASSFNKELANRVGEMLGEDALWAGYSGFYGVGVNTHRSAYDGRAFEYYSEDGFLAGKQAARLTEGLQSKGCNAYAKHIVGYEQQNNRVGLSVWSNEQAFREIYLKPFQMAFVEGKAMNTMTAYSRLGLTLCPASENLMEGFVRGECGMKGIIISDMWTGRYTNGQLPTCIQAGLSLTDSDLDSASLFAAYRENHGAYAWKMREAAKHILYS
ncbi:MAG: glycoside hydrolase family 3 protein, partial [Bacilli bacterium]|nr:glycoside hydrolase family 3 protein [Bacilli bacterium]